jgi:glycosidase
VKRAATALLAFALACACTADSAPAAPTGTHASSGVWYEIFVRSWYDTNGDGIGDLNGVTAKLDYLQKLGIDGIWLMPINPSPSYHGYDITDYEAINPQYGTLGDFRRLLDEAHKRGIKVIIDMVINHTSNEHPWFKAALDPHSPYHGWYTWAGKYTDLDAPSAFGGEAWRSAGQQHYLGIFDRSMPDLDYDNPAVRERMIRIGKFWLQQGVDGFRLDAAQHIYQDFAQDMVGRAALDKNIAWWNEYRRGLEAANARVYLVGEVAMQLVQSGDPVNAENTHTDVPGMVVRPKAADLAPYLQPLDAVFDFPQARQLISAAASERNLALATTLENTYATYRAATGSTTIKDAPLLSNHDQDRVMSQLDDNFEHMRMAAAMLLTLPGEPYIYYGEELGMRGRKPDPELRTPMRWQRSPDAHGETTWHANSPANAAAVSVQAERADPHSLLSFYTRLIHWRAGIPALRDGDFRAYPEASDHLAAWVRNDGADTVLVVHNLSGKTQSMALDVPGEPRFTRVFEQTGRDATIRGDTLSIPPYTSALLR